MCGIAGFWESPQHPLPVLRVRAQAMGGALAHRGPDGDGVWCDPACGVGLAHRRLAILDLSARGAQPMASGCGRYVIVFNGEVYNFAVLRAELERRGARFAGDSDTEVVLEAIAAWGLEPSLARFTGMFAFALWDRRQRSLTLVRDRLGIKPLYFGIHHGAVLFGSELKALRAHPAFRPSVDPSALALFLRHGYVPDPWSIHEGIGKLAPGHLAVFRSRGAPLIRAWWDARAVAREAAALPLQDDRIEVADRLESLLRDAVALRLQSDVPVGAFLSGGIDSSTVVALMAARAGGRVRTYTIGFEEGEFDESAHARAVAAHLGTDHTELRVTAAEALGVIPQLPRIWDEPFADSSQIPTYLVSRLARTGVVVALSGDGGDELFGGYPRYRHAHRIAAATTWAPLGVRRSVARLLESLARSGGELAVPTWRHRLRRLAGFLDVKSPQELYRVLVSQWPDPSVLLPPGREPVTPFTDPLLAADLPGLRERFAFLDAVTYLPGDILTKVDRASMAVGLEARVPLLDHRVVELAWRLPWPLRSGSGPGKAPLRDVLARFVPMTLFQRPKRGFAIPVARWLRGPLRPWAEDLLSIRNLQGGPLDAATVRRTWSAHLDGDSRHHARLWSVLMFQAWLARQRAPAAVEEVPA